MIEKIEGIIISEKSYSETSKIISIITYKYGVINVLAKGVRALKSPLRSSTSKLIRGNFNIIYKKDKLSTLIDVDIIDFYKNIKRDINKISYASYILELTEQVIKQCNDDNVYSNLVASLDKINDGFEAMIITNILELKYLKCLGVMPIIDCCSKCGSTSIITISSDAGGYLCRSCRQNETIVSERTIKLIRMFYFVDIGKISKLEISDKVREEINCFLNNYYDKYTGLYLKSKKMIQKLIKVSDLC